MYKTLPKNVISFFPHFPHFEIFSQMHFLQQCNIIEFVHGEVRSAGAKTAQTT